jgi:hypothetical protein
VCNYILAFGRTFVLVGVAVSPPLVPFLISSFLLGAWGKGRGVSMTVIGAGCCQLNVGWQFCWLDWCVCCGANCFRLVCFACLGRKLYGFFVSMSFCLIAFLFCVMHLHWGRVVGRDVMAGGCVAWEVEIPCDVCLC